MKLEGKRVGFVLTGAFCMVKSTILQMKNILEQGGEVIPIMSENTYIMNNKFGKSADIIAKIREIIGKEKIITTVEEAEQIGSKHMTDIILVAPASGNTIAKLAHGITDTVATVSVKYNLRNGNPVVLSISTTDGLSGNAENIGKLLNTKNIFFVPFRQDNPITKPYSLTSAPNYIVPALEYALEFEQIQPVIL